ncbi:MAG TPA: 4-hydroxy-tetrahydrodipicolinate synthase [Longimicrobium sp.]|jgi:4-hydroxy-tetrahydrodipicolinate synthase|uniref:4-hydroxy-tetrahydrodipicolinate synthase n=1 Tax=Longimicrobium sp. TaxID=2029185 RepID=UPI002EDA8A40
MTSSADRGTLFTGSGVALVTPMGRDGAPNLAVLRELVRFHLREGTDALIVNGSTGEAATLSLDEQREAVRAVADEVRSAERRIPVVAGCGGSDTAQVAQVAAAAREAGADALLIAPPPYNKPPQRGIVAHFQKVMDAGGDLPVIVYNVPGRTACNILPETVEQMAADPRIVGIKEASGDISQIAEVARRVGGRVALYSGNDDQIVPVMSLGGKGVISVLANIAPRDTSRMAKAFLEGNTAEACALQLRYLPLVAALFREGNPIPVKAAVGLLGFDVGEPRLPLVPVSDAVRAELQAAMRDVGLLGAG